VRLVVSIVERRRDREGDIARDESIKVLVSTFQRNEQRVKTSKVVSGGVLIDVMYHSDLHDCLQI